VITQSYFGAKIFLECQCDKMSGQLRLFKNSSHFQPLFLFIKKALSNKQFFLLNLLNKKICSTKMTANNTLENSHSVVENSFLYNCNCNLLKFSGKGNYLQDQEGQKVS